MEEKQLREIIEGVLRELKISPGISLSGAEPAAEKNGVVIESGLVPDVTDADITKQYLVENPENKEAYQELRQYAPCRLAIGRAGARYKTLPMLQFCAAHSAAQDAVLGEADEEFIAGMNLFTVQTRCGDKETYIKRPDLGRRLSDEGAAEIKSRCKKSTVQIFVADGLSSAAVSGNVADLLPAIEQGLFSFGIDFAAPFFVKYGRVAVMDEVSELVGADVTCVLIGERPGLITAQSMSAYIAYKAVIGMPESRRTVISNIHSAGTAPVEAGAHIAEVIKLILEHRASGTDLKL